MGSYICYDLIWWAIFYQRRWHVWDGYGSNSQLSFPLHIISDGEVTEFICAQVQKPDHPDLNTIDEIQAWLATPTLCGLLCGKQWWFIFMLFWDCGNFKVVCLLKGRNRVDFPPFLALNENKASILCSWQRETRNRASWMKYSIVISGSSLLQSQGHTTSNH